MLAILFVALHAVLRFSGARLQLARLREVHRCEAGGVQSLSFVLTLPLFLTIVMFIAQIGLLMVGNITVNTAAFAAARSAAVWVPAYVSELEPENRLPPGITAGTNLRIDSTNARTSPKYSKIFDAATLACVPIAPSREIPGIDPSGLNGAPADDALVRLYAAMAPQSQSSSVMPQRLRRKLAYSVQNTWVDITFVDKDSGVTAGSTMGPTYNPPDGAIMTSTGPWVHIPSEVGWQDPVTIDVWHRFALLPGPGRFLASSLAGYTGQPDEIADSILQEDGVQMIWLHGSATLTVEGIKTVRPYVQQP